MMNAMVAVVVVLFWCVPCLAAGKLEPTPTRGDADCEIASGSMELCKEECYRDTCVLLRAVSMALCESPLSPKIVVMTYIPATSPRAVMVVAMLDGRHAWSWRVDLDINNDDASLKKRSLTDTEIYFAAEELARRVNKRTWGWILDVE